MRKLRAETKKTEGRGLRSEAGPVSKALRAAGLDEYLVHTGQHYDYGMSQGFFDELELPVPDIHLGIGSGAHGVQTGRMLAKIEEVLLDQKPDWLLIYGDTNSTLAGALAASKLHVPVAQLSPPPGRVTGPRTIQFSTATAVPPVASPNACRRTPCPDCPKGLRSSSYKMW